MLRQAKGAQYNSWIEKAEADRYGLMIRNHKSYRASGVPPAISSEFRPRIVPKSPFCPLFWQTDKQTDKQMARPSDMREAPSICSDNRSR